VIGGVTSSYAVIPAKAGTQTRDFGQSGASLSASSLWVPAFAGMTRAGGTLRHGRQPEHCGREIIPHRVISLDEFDFPIALPFLNPFFADDGVTDVVKGLDVDETLNIVLLGESGNETLTMLENPLSQIAGDAGIKRAVASACEDVDMSGQDDAPYHELQRVWVPAFAGATGSIADA